MLERAISARDEALRITLEAFDLKPVNIRLSVGAHSGSGQ